VLQVLMTAPGQRINRPDLGTPISQLLFAPLTDELTSLVEAQIARALNKWLDKVIVVESVAARQMELTRLEVDVIYTILASGARVKTMAEVTP
jgi:phage baseplate assembly protein W